MGLEFLKSIVLAEPTKERKTPIRTKQELNPTNGADLRLFKDGRVYPSEALVAKMDLEYRADGSGNGLDVIDSREWGAYPKDATPVVFVAAVPRIEGKLDLFRKAEEGASVLTQGASSFGKQLIKILQEVYHVTMFVNCNHVDLKIVEEYPVNTPDEIYHVPKTFSRGDQKGEKTTVRRESITLFPLVLHTGEDITSDETSPVEVEVGHEVAVN